jgi:membrane protein YdbS with pleckstrin-like domain
MPKAWFLQQNGKTYGPLSSEKLKAYSAAGKLSADGRVANSKEGPWHPVTKIKGLATAMPSGKPKGQSAKPAAPPVLKSAPPAIVQAEQSAVATPPQKAQLSSKIETDVWAGCPSQITNLKTFILCALTFWLLVPIFVAVWRYFLVKTTRYELTTQRFRASYGVIAKKTDELELYRVKDTAFSQTMFQRMFKLGTVSMTSSDSTTPHAAIESIPAGKAKELRETMRNLVEELRDRKGVREIDYA